MPTTSPWRRTALQYPGIPGNIASAVLARILDAFVNSFNLSSGASTRFRPYKAFLSTHEPSDD